MARVAALLGLAVGLGTALSCSGPQEAAPAADLFAAADGVRFVPSVDGEPHNRLIHLAGPGYSNGINRGRLAVLYIREPGDFAHRNYCGPGATQVLLSAWIDRVPDLEVIALRSHLNPKRGATGANAAVAINSFLNPIVMPALGHPRYRAERITTLAAVKDRIKKDFFDPEALRLFGHGLPVMVQTMTGTMPGWNHWNATHMITIFAFDFSHNDPALDTITYVETSSRLTGYRGRGLETISVKALWTAMHAFIVQAPYDPMNIIS